MDSNEVLKKFGKYFLLDLVAQGGMAEIYRARMATPDGGARLLAIKRVLPSYSQNQEFVAMFKGEINTTSGFTHPNIVQIYDFGEYQGQLYLAMELVDGKNLRQYLGRSLEQKKTFPIDVACYIIEQAALGLHYAHTFKDKITNKPLNIVHRDISPQNILVSFDGAVKVIDFGIAKGQNQSEHTRTGVIKGKPSYLSPEQIRGEALDGRSDIFALGIVLWEVLCGRKLFGGDNDFAIIKMIENCEATVKKPSEINSQVPPELDSIVLKSLRKKREERYANAEEFARALRKFLNQYNPDFSVSDVAYFTKNLFVNEIVADREKLKKLNEKAESLLSLESTTKANFKTEATATVPMQQPTRMIHRESKQIELQDTQLKTSANIKLETKVERSQGTQFNRIPSQTYSKQIQVENSTKSKFSFVKVAAVLAIASVLGYYYLNSSKDSATKRTVASKNETSLGKLVLTSNVSQATILLNDKDKNFPKSFPAEIQGLPVDEPIKLTVVSNGFKKHEQIIKIDSSSKELKLNVNLEREEEFSQSTTAASSSLIPLRLNILPVSVSEPTEVIINGVSVDPYAPVGQVPIGSDFVVTVWRKGFKPIKKVYHFSEADVQGKTEITQNIELEPTKYGVLSIKTNPQADITIDINGIEVKGNSASFRKELPVGVYNVKFYNSVLDFSFTMQVKIDEGKIQNITGNLSQIREIYKDRVPASN
jgi:serine/threonine-protein kinase